jgi:hypothetical protein
MSIFTSLVTDTLEVPGEPGQSITIRKLAPKHLDAAAKVAFERPAAEKMASAAPDLMKLGPAQLGPMSGEQAGHLVGESSMSDPLYYYDPIAIIEAGVTGWTYPYPLDRDAFEDIDRVTRNWLATAIVKLARPDLFQTVPEQEAAQVKG